MSKDVEETAKAAQEIAKTTSNAIDAGREMGGFISRFISVPLEQGMGIFEDKLRYKRWERQISLINKANEYLNELGIDTPNKPIPIKNAVPLLEYATLEEDDNLQDMWARLLVNGSVESTGIKLERSYIEILAQISTLEAQILEAIYRLPFEVSSHRGIFTEDLPGSASIAEEEPKKQPEEPSEEVKLALSNLVRIGCLKFPATWGGREIYTKVNPTLIGSKFVAACTIKTK